MSRNSALEEFNVNRLAVIQDDMCSVLRSLECFVITKCTKFGQLIPRKIIKIVATRCPILRIKCTKIYFGWGSAPSAEGAYSVPPDPIAKFKGPTSKRREREGKEEGKGREGGKEGRGKRSPC